MLEFRREAILKFAEAEGAIDAPPTKLRRRAEEAHKDVKAGRGGDESYSSRGELLKEISWYAGIAGVPVL